MKNTIHAGKTVFAEQIGMRFVVVHDPNETIHCDYHILSVLTEGKKKKKGISGVVFACWCNPLTFYLDDGLLLLDEGVGNLQGTVHGGDQNDRGSTADHQAQSPGLVQQTAILWIYLRVT